jgi:DNA-binding transcriptional ArsR family regulator
MSLIFEANFDDCIAPPRNVRASTATLVCLALADHANDEGKGAYPSIDRLASKTKLSRRSVIYTLEALQEAGIITKVGYSEYGTACY